MPTGPASSLFAAIARMPRPRLLGSFTGGAVGALLGVCAASHGHVAASVVLIMAACGAVLGYADACWREPPPSPARSEPVR